MLKQLKSINEPYVPPTTIRIIKNKLQRFGQGKQHSLKSTSNINNKKNIPNTKHTLNTVLDGNK